MRFTSLELRLFMDDELARIHGELADAEQQAKAQQLRDRMTDHNVNFEIGERGGAVYFEFFV